jgi:hypothetical protein
MTALMSRSSMVGLYMRESERDMGPRNAKNVAARSCGVAGIAWSGNAAAAAAAAAGLALPWWVARESRTRSPADAPRTSPKAPLACPHSATTRPCRPRSTRRSHQSALATRSAVVTARDATVSAESSPCVESLGLEGG